MIKKIKNKFKSFIEIRVIKVVENQRLLMQTNNSYNQISKLFNDSTFIPFSAWAISPNTILHILNDITINKRKAVIEFGAGASTFYIAKLICSLQLETIFYSVESDPDWAEELKRQLKILKLDKVVQVIYAPIEEVPEGISLMQQKTWYDTKILNSSLDLSVEFDLVLVDGPVGANTPFSRYTAVPFLKDRLCSEFSIFLDDVNRSHEKKIAEEWQKLLGCKTVFYDRYAILTNTENFDTLPFQLGN